VRHSFEIQQQVIDKDIRMNKQASLDGLNQYKTMSELEACLPDIMASPKSSGSVGMIVCRPRNDDRKILQTCELTLSDGLVGDNWKQRGEWRSPEKPANLDTQLNLMNLRAITAIAADHTQWPLAGDQFFVDFDLSKNNLPPGTRLKIGSAEIEVTAEPHLGCRKFSDRFGRDAVMFVNSDQGKQINLRGINARVIKAGTVSLGDTISKT
jgi:hypothetical protein